MKKYLVVLILVASSLSTQLYGQISFTNGRNTMELSGLLDFYYNYRVLQNSVATDHIDNISTNPLDKKKNVFSIPNARFKIEGKVANDFEYKFQIDLAELGTTANGENPPVNDLNFTYKGLKLFNIIGGYQKLPYSGNALANLQNQPYWQRPEITRGSIFSIRDMGVTLTRALWRQRINLYGGIYSGQGEYILTSITNGDNDSKGTPEYVGRVDISTTRFRPSEIYDMENAVIPGVTLGINARHVQRTTSITGVEDWNLKVVAGNKTILGMDLAARYRGFSSQLEVHQIIIHPNGYADTVLLQGKNTNFYRASGGFWALNYFSKALKTGLFARYDNFMPNDLIQDEQAGNNLGAKLSKALGGGAVMEQTLSFGFTYHVDGWRSVVKFQYLDRLDKKDPNQIRRDNEFRIGWQQTF